MAVVCVVFVVEVAVVWVGNRIGGEGSGSASGVHAGHFGIRRSNGTLVP